MKTKITGLLILLAFFFGFKTYGQSCVASYTYAQDPAGYGQINFASTSTGVNANTKYSWYLGNGNVITGDSATIAYTYSYNGTYHVSLLIRDSMGACFDSISGSVVVTSALNSPSLPANFTYTVTGGQVACTQTNPYPYNHWDFGDGGT